MKFKLLFLFVLISANSWLSSTTWHIKQDSTGNFTTIQEGIIAATDSDTILVYPGTYYENIDYLEKSLTVASLYLITPADSLIDQTIIDGNQQFRCVTIDDCLNASLIGFTIQNGLALVENSTINSSGGGIYVDNVLNTLISSCNIKNNKALFDGGISLNHTNAILEGNTISYNWGLLYAGGLSLSGNDASIDFSETNLNNIYLNYSCTGSDIGIMYNVQNIVNIIVDTLTVNNPDFFFISPSYLCTISNLHTKIEQIDQDLYVSPDGDDGNSGLIPEDPLQTIAWAQTLIKRNDENPNTIYLAPGTYSPSLNNQKYPLSIKHGVKYVGASSEETIIDAEEQTPLFFCGIKENIYVSLNLKDLTLINAHTFGFPSVGAIHITYQADVHLENIVIENCFGDIASAIFCKDGFYTLNNVCVKDNLGGFEISLHANYQNQNPVLDIEIKNSIIRDNSPGSVEDGDGGLSLGGHFNIPGNYSAKLINCEISGNHSDFYNPQTGLGGSAGLHMNNNIIIDAVNCTFGDNTLSHNTGCVITVNDAELNMYNSILYNNDGYSFNLWENALVNISHSLIEGGDGNVNYYYPLAVVNWLEGNLDEDPLWQNSGEFPYSLSAGSPCIDTGTLDLPPGIELPEYDLAGNPRIFGETIDMGAYEWQGTPVENYELGITNFELNNYPNPFNPTTTISFSIPEESKVELSVYSIKGQKVKSLVKESFERGYHSIIWDGNDVTGKPVSSGIYFYKLNVNSKIKGVKKMILLK